MKIDYVKGTFITGSIALVIAFLAFVYPIYKDISVPEPDLVAKIAIRSAQMPLRAIKEEVENIWTKRAGWLVNRLTGNSHIELDENQLAAWISGPPSYLGDIEYELQKYEAQIIVEVTNIGDRPAPDVVVYARSIWIKDVTVRPNDREINLGDGKIEIGEIAPGESITLEVWSSVMPSQFMLDSDFNVSSGVGPAERVIRVATMQEDTDSSLFWFIIFWGIASLSAPVFVMGIRYWYVISRDLDTATTIFAKDWSETNKKKRKDKSA